MRKVYFNSRDELVAVNLDLLAAVVANGNYSRLLYINKRETVLTVSIAKIEQALSGCNDADNRYLRLGRSVIVNHKYLSRIELVKQQLVLSDGEKNDIRIRIPKQSLRNYKDALAQKDAK